MKRFAILGCFIVLATGCVHKVMLESGEEISFPRGARVMRLKAQPGMHIVQPGMTREVEGYVSLLKLTESGTVVIIDEQPKYDYAHGFAVYFVPDRNPEKTSLIFRGDSFPIRMVRESEWKKISNKKTRVLALPRQILISDVRAL